MVALSVGKKRELGVLSSMLTKTIGTIGLMAILVSCGGGSGRGYSYTVGGIVSGLAGSVVLHNSTGETLSISANGIFSFATPLHNGDAYTVTVETQPPFLSQTCTVSNGSGIINDVPVFSVVVSCVTPPLHSVTVDPTGKFAYVANTGDKTISAYTINSSTGALTAVGTTAVTAGTNPYSVTVDPLGKFAYVANMGDGNISGYVIETGPTPPAGTLTPITTSPFTAGMAPSSVTVDPTGKFAYVANTGDNTISAYTIDSTGALTSPMIVDTGKNPYSVTVDPTGKFAYVANYSSNAISAYTIDSTGALTSPTIVATGTNPYSVTVDPTGKFAYVANTGSKNISAYTIGSTGVLTPISGSPFKAGKKPYFVTVDPTGKFAYVVNTGDNTIFAYTINSSTGALTAVGTTAVTAGTNPYYVTVDPLGQFAYVANTGDGNISGYVIETGPTPPAGTLTPIITSPFTAGTNPSSVTIVPLSGGEFAAYAANYNSANISAYTIDQITTLGALINPTTVDAGTNPY